MFLHSNIFVPLDIIAMKKLIIIKGDEIMYLYIGVLFLAVFMIVLLQIYLFPKAPLWVSKIVIVVLSLAIIGTLTVHGIWLGISFMTLGLIWLKISGKSKIETERG